MGSLWLGYRNSSARTRSYYWFGVRNSASSLLISVIVFQPMILCSQNCMKPWCPMHRYSAWSAHWLGEKHVADSCAAYVERRVGSAPTRNVRCQSPASARGKTRLTSQKGEMWMNDGEEQSMSHVGP